MTEEDIITFHNFSFTYADTTKGVFDIELVIKKGECVVLTGASGCGKTTLTRCVNGLIPDFYEGEITGEGDVCGLKVGECETGAYAGSVGSVFQDPRSQFFTLKVNTEISFPSENLGMPRDEIQKNYKNAVAQMELVPILKRNILDLSSGEKQKTAIASVYTMKAPVYVLDEPSANLDAEGIWQLTRTLKRLKEEGCTILISEHRLHFLKELADRVLILEEGKIVRELRQKEFLKNAKELQQYPIRQIDLEQVVCSKPKITPPKPMHTFAVDSLSFSYGKEELWKEVSFSCESGAIVGIFGENGSGKTTMLQTLMGLKKPKKGQRMLDGKKISKQELRRNSFYMMQDADYQFVADSVMEEMLSGQKGSRDEKKARELLAYYGLLAYQDIHPSLLSGGQKQRLSMALLEMSDSLLLFFDEPTSGLDAHNMEMVREHMLRLAREGRILFVITHDYEFAASLFTAMLWIKKDNTVCYIPENKYQPEKLRAIMIKGGTQNE